MAPILDLLRAAAQVILATSSRVIPSVTTTTATTTITHARIPDLNITLTPNFLDCSSISSLDIRLVLDRPDVPVNDVLVTMPKMIAWLPATRYEDGDIQAFDKRGPLSLSINDIGPDNNTRTWVPSRDTIGNVVLSFRVHPREVNSSTRPAPRVDLRTDQGGIIGGGESFLPSPPNRDDTYSINVAWNLTTAPAGTSAVWSFGDGVAAQRVGPVEDFLSIYAVGPIHSYKNSLTDPKSGRPREYGMYWIGEPPFNATELASDIENLYANMQEFFQDEDSVFRVFIRKSVTRDYGGTGNARSFMIVYDNDFGNFVSVTGLDLFNLLAHEMVHEYPLMGEDSHSVWFTEGIATYYAGILPYRFGNFDRLQFHQEMNHLAAAYYTSPMVNLSEEEAYGLSNYYMHAQRLPYYRGAMYFTRLDFEIRAASNGDRSLTDLILPFVRLRYARKTHSLNEWVELLKAELGDAAVRDLYDMLDAKLVIPSPDSLAYAGLKLVRSDQETYELGFDEVSFTERKIVGLQRGTRAWLSGLQEGDAIVKHPPIFQSANDIALNMTVRVMRGEYTVDISYWPRTWEKVESYQWVAVEDEEDEEHKELRFL
jgi:hypothetical protein